LKKSVESLSTIPECFQNRLLKSLQKYKTLNRILSTYLMKILSKIKKIINDTHLRIRINYKRFADPVYLLLNSLYTDESPPESKQATIRFWLANLHISKEALVSIIRYVNNVVISNIKRDCDSYKKRTANNLIRSFHEFIGCCETADLIAYEYLAFFQKIQSELKGKMGPLILKLPERNEIREGVWQSLIRTRKGQYVAFPSIRLACELPIIEDLGIKIKNTINQRKNKVRIEDIRFTHNAKIEELFSLMRKMSLGSNDEISVLARIHDWGSKSVHNGQIIPVSLVWYSFFFVKEDLRKMLHANSSLSYSETNKIYKELIARKKIKVARKGERFIPSLFNVLQTL
jgi:hypothetical protein